MRRRQALAVLGAAVLAPACRVRVGPAATTLPTLQLRMLSGEAAWLADLTAGKPALLDFFATWCKPCREAAPRLRELDTLARSRGQALIGVSVGEGAAEVRRFVAEFRLTHPILLDPDYELADRMGATRLPTYLVADASGRIVHRAHALDGATDAALAGVALTAHQ